MFEEIVENVQNFTPIPRPDFAQKKKKNTTGKKNMPKKTPIAEKLRIATKK